MLKMGSKRRRTNKQIVEDNEEAIRQEAETQLQLAELAELRARIGLLEE